MSEKNRTIMLISLVLLALSLAFLYQGISSANRNLEQSIAMAEESLDFTLLAVEEFSFAPYKARIKNLTDTHPQIVEAFAQQERELLYQLVLPRYQALQKENEFFHVMHFHLPDATTFLRMHDPDFHGDSLKNIRPIVDAVHEKKELLTGFEIGRHGPFYRIVYPVFHQNKYVGAIEFGIKAHVTLDALERRTPHVTSSYFNREHWETILAPPNDQQIVVGNYIVYTHGNTLFTKFPSDFDISLGDQFVDIDKKNYIAHFHSNFEDFQSNSIGGLIVLQDITQLIAEKKQFITEAIIFTSVLCLISFFVLFFSFGKIVTRLTNAEKNASKAKAEWERTFDAVPDMISILDDQHQIVRANKAMAKFLGVPIKKLIHTKCYKSVHGTEEPPDDCPHVKLLNDHQPHTTEIFDDRLQRYLAITVSPLEDSEGNFFGSVHIARDISDQKIAEKERLLAEEKLQKAEKMEAIGLMAGGVAHDLNNILSGVVSYPELLLLQLSREDVLYKPIQAIQKSGKRAAAVVADLLTVARGVASVKEVSSINTLTESYLDSTEFKNLQSLHPNVSLHSEFAEDLWHIQCSPVHIQKVLMNLIINAFEAIVLTGSVQITTTNQSIAATRTKESSLESGEYVVLTIKDSGFGIAKHDLERIFEPFYTKKVMGRSGTGLGLAVVWNTMKDHSAIIRVDSDNNGTTFTLYFPPCHKGAIQQKADTDIMSLKGEGTVLVVDDEEQQRDIAAQMLTILGYTAEVVSSGEEAVAYCRENSVDLLLLDMLMAPGISGLETFQQIIKFSPSQKAVIASGFSENSNVIDAQALGVGSFIKKPYSIEQLGEAAQKELRG